MANPRLTEQEQVASTDDTARPGAATTSSTLAHVVGLAGGVEPDKLAATIVRLGYQNDAGLWIAIQQQLGNACATRVRAAMIPRAPVVDVPTADDEVLVVARVAELFGIRVIAAAGVRARAIDACSEFIADEIGNNPQLQHRMAKAKVTIVIIPSGVAMTDVDQFKGLDHGKTFDGRDWSKVRGSGGMATPDGNFSIAIAEENLVQIKGLSTLYPPTYSIGMHEFAHGVELEGLSRDQRARIVALYNAHKAADPGDRNDTWTDAYSSDNELEYFAQCTNAFFGKNDMHDYHNGRDWLRDHDPDMFAFLSELYKA